MRRRSRRGRMFSLGLFFIIYSAINVYSSSEIGGSLSNTPRPDIETDLSTLLPKSTIIPNDDETVFLSTQEYPQSTITTPKRKSNHILKIKSKKFHYFHSNVYSIWFFFPIDYY